MRVIIAGYNVDSSLLHNLDQDLATPEVLSAAYARISRSVKTASELRIEALREIAKARTSNQKIIFEMGHASVAEHAVFNIDLIGISRCLTEQVQRSRLASFTEKSQRYVTFDRDYVVPAELDATEALKHEYTRLCDLLFEEYALSLDTLVEQLAETHPQLGKRDLETMAKEDARYILPLATKTQMGMTINARSLEVLLRRLSSVSTNEAKLLWDKLYSQVSAISPSLIRYTSAQPGEFCLESVVPKPPDQPHRWAKQLPSSTLLSSTAQADELILAILLFEQGHGDPQTWQLHLSRLSDSAKSGLWQRLFQDLKPWQKLPRAFEAMELDYLLELSECAWGQLKRHRSATLIKSSHIDSGGPLVIPPSIQISGRQDRWQELASQVFAFRDKLAGPLRPYLRINAEAVKVYARLNLRELYHFSRLRSDEHAQWEIRQLSDVMVSLAKASAPNATAFLGGKSSFDSLIR